MPEFDARDQARQVNVAGDNTGTIDASVHAPPPPRPVVTTALRRDVGVFIDREDELQRILDAVGAVSVHTVDGMAGVGKTALVTRAAHVLAPKFPDGRYFIDLHTHTPGHSPADPADVLGRLLIGLGIDPRNIPDSLDGRRDQWRDRLTGKRVLLVLDDARDHAQIEPLLPAGPDCLTLVTSRRRLIALDAAKPLALDVLDHALAVELFCVLAHRPAMTGADQRAVARIVELCGFLPLAIALLAGRLAHHPAWTIPALADGFAATSDRLTELDAGDRAVYAAFTMSYQHLPPVRQRLFRCLGLHPGIDIDIAATAALAGLRTTEARRELDALYVDHLIDETMPGRYRLHDLLREYARVLAAADPSDDNGRALDRLLDYYQHTAVNADRRLAHSTRPARSAAAAVAAGVVIRDFGAEVQALSWLRSERVNLLNCLDYAAAHQISRVADLTGALAGLLEYDGPWPQAQTLHRQAQVTARQLGDRIGDANALTDLGRTHALTERHAEAIDLYQQALDGYRDLGNRLGEANALTYCGALRQWVGDDAGTAELHQALGIYRDLGDRLGEANALVYLGALRQWIGGDAATAELRQALTLYRDVGYRFGEATTLMNLGFHCQRNGDYAEAVTLCGQALVIYRDLGNRFGEATTLTNLGVVHQRTGNFAEAIAASEQARAILHEIGNRLGEAHALGNLGIVHRRTGDYTAASALFQRAVAILRELGSGFWEAIAFNEIGQLLIDTGELRNALDVFTDALGFARGTGNSFEQARALEGLARCRTGLGEHSAAVTDLREAVEIYQRLGVPEAEPAAEYLSTLEHDAPSP
ncbi:tetratricopeptide repeat protein [Nocardia sp. NPDC051756]|uniref:ATP-binding protein n=1 Tax=Nocardia sp. NPDC051756 TaxID=3154751 RepID=UPI00342798E3